ncbi:MAG: hypothetical protein FWD57_09725, partial [Polyangiaceae bacterium]|nr:hypothetical protein [Polyangiaceae bacterium]
VFAAMIAGEGSPCGIVKSRGLDRRTSEEDLRVLMEGVLRDNADKVAEYRAGKVALKGYFVGLMMRACKGKGNPKAIGDMLDEFLGG